MALLSWGYGPLNSVELLRYLNIHVSVKAYTLLQYLTKVYVRKDEGEQCKPQQ